MRILHTSDWHLGRSLYRLNRHHEFAAFLDWLIDTISTHKIGALIVAGDIFDTSTPGNRAQALYYNFLGRITTTCCKNVVIVAGNHDSPTFLDAPKEILKAMNVHVIGNLSENRQDQLIVLNDENQQPAAVVCAVPYLRDRDIRSVEAGETIEDKANKLLEGMHNHYAELGELAAAKSKELGDLPIIATGHLFTAGGKTVSEDGVKELYVGTIAHAPTSIFPSCIDYCALGHLHVPQLAGGQEHIRYCGSPIPMGFGEAKQQKKVIVVEFDGRTPQIEEICVPCFQPLEKIEGSFDQICQRIKELAAKDSNAWVEVEYTGQAILPDLQQNINDLLDETRMILTRCINLPLIKSMTAIGESQNVAVNELNEHEVFRLCLSARQVPEEQHDELLQAYNEVLDSMDDEQNEEANHENS